MKSIKDIEPMLKNLVQEMEKTVPYAAAWAQDALGEQLLVDSRESRAEALERQQGVVLTVFTGRSFLEYALNGVATAEFCDRLTAGAEELLKAALTEGIVDIGLSIDPGTPLTQDFAAIAKIPPEQIALSEKMATLRELRDNLHDRDPRVVNATALCAHVKRCELFVNRSRSLYQELPRTQVVAQVVLCEGDHTARITWRTLLSGRLSSTRILGTRSGNG